VDKICNNLPKLRRLKANYKLGQMHRVANLRKLEQLEELILINTGELFSFYQNNSAMENFKEQFLRLMPRLKCFNTEGFVEDEDIDSLFHLDERQLLEPCLLEECFTSSSLM